MGSEIKLPDTFGKQDSITFDPINGDSFSHTKFGDLSYGEGETIFSDEMNEELSSSRFYAQPKNTELRICFNEGEDNLIIGNAVVMNVEHTDEKIPIYSYNSDLFKKFLKGKSVITGVIALRKTTVDKIIALMKTTDIPDNNSNKIKKLTEELESVKELINDSINNSNENGIYYSFYKSKEEELKNKIRELEENTLALSSKNNNPFTKNYEMFSSNIKADLLYYNNFTNNNSAVLTISYKDDFIEDVDKITDILFTKKQTEINVGRNDIIEIYHFIGNPSKNI